MKTRGTITLVFDDGYEDVYEQVIPLLARYNVQAVFAIPLQPEHDMIDGSRIQPVADWVDAAKRHGHEIAAHGVSHQSLSAMSSAQRTKELKESHEATHATSLVYPGGAYDDHVLEAAKKYFTAARSVVFGMETIPPTSPYELKTINYTKKNFSVARANVYALKALAQNKWLIETFHMVRSSHSDMKHFVFLDDLDAHLAFITSLPVSIRTMQGIVK